MTVFIICHSTLPDYPTPPDAKIMWMSAKAPPETDLEVVNGYDFFDNPETLHDLLSGSLGALAIHRYLVSQQVSTGSVTIWQYRKFVTADPVGRPSPNYPGMNLVGIEEARALSLSEPQQAPFVVAAPVKVGNLLRQYSISHNVIDLLRYTTLSIEIGLILQTKAVDLFNESLLVPGGMELGTYPATWWMRLYEKLANLSLKFVESHKPLDTAHPYQRRAVAFCQERFGSQILLDQLRNSRAASPDAPGYSVGVMHTVTDDERYRGGAS